MVALKRLVSWQAEWLSDKSAVKGRMAKVLCLSSEIFSSILGMQKSTVKRMTSFLKTASI